MLGAEYLGLKKEYKDGTLRDFSFADGINFKHFHGKPQNQTYIFLKF